MPARIVVAIDGTDSSEWKRRDGYNSHVSRFLQDFVTTPRLKHYVPGPSIDGVGTQAIANESADWLARTIFRLVADENVQQRDLKICIVGHSRGCSAAIRLANRIKNDFQNIVPGMRFVNLTLPIRIQFMGLYDAVDRVVGSDADTGEGLRHVERICHVRRRNISRNGTRPMFGTMAISGQHAFLFDTSHGGMGGDPGFFNELTIMMDSLAGRAFDPYCNAWDVILTPEQLRRINPRATPLDAIGRASRLRQLRGFLANSRGADLMIRTMAQAAGMVFRPEASPHLPYHDDQQVFWNQLQGMFREADTIKPPDSLSPKPDTSSSSESRA